MHKLPLKVAFVVLLSTFLLLGLYRSSLAQDVTSSGVAETIVLPGDQEEGALVCSGREGYKLCSLSYDASMFGVIVKEPSASFTYESLPDQKFLVSSGIALVRVSAENGNIAEGDLLTSSTKEGVAQRADRNGYVLGTALGPFESDSSDTIGTVLVSLNVHPSTSFTDDANRNLIEIIRQGLSAPLLTPIAALRYVLASGVSIASFLLAFVYFGRLARTGVEAIGRNPLAHRTIQLAVFVQIAITILIFLAGLGFAYLILAF